jgi:hypothetical protein
LRTPGSLRLLSALRIELLYLFLLIDAILKTFELGELRDGAFIDIFDTFESFLANSFLIVCQNESSELTSPEEIFALIFSLWQRENRFSWIVALWLLVWTEFELKFLVNYLEVLRDSCPKGAHFLGNTFFE